MAGRIPLLQQGDIINRVSQSLSSGSSIKDACDYAKIGESTYFAWREKGEKLRVQRDNGKALSDGDLLYIEFLETTTHARASAMIRATAILQKFIADNDPNNPVDPRLRLDAVKFYLERRDPENWGRQVRDVNIQNDKPLQIEVVRKDTRKNTARTKRST